MRLWDLAGRRQMNAFNGHDGPVLAVAFSADGRTAVSAGGDGAVIHWNLAEGRRIRSIAAHTGMIWAVGVTPDGRFVVSAGSDETIRVWHLKPATASAFRWPRTRPPNPG